MADETSPERGEQNGEDVGTSNGLDSREMIEAKKVNPRVSWVSATAGLASAAETMTNFSRVVGRVIWHHKRQK